MDCESSIPNENFISLTSSKGESIGMASRDFRGKKHGKCHLYPFVVLKAILAAMYHIQSGKQSVWDHDGCVSAMLS